MSGRCGEWACPTCGERTRAGMLCDRCDVHNLFMDDPKPRAGTPPRMKDQHEGERR